jgi:NAD(P)-dependent dehydrogenase (short-subunit alcohol dehydrogenase family)
MILIAGSKGLIGTAITRHWGELATGYDLPDALPPTGIDYGAFIDCARYADQKDQIATWHTVIKQLQRKGAGRMILFSSIYGHKAPDFGIYPGTEIPETPLEYAMSKAATEQATRFLAQKLKPYNIQVNCIAPGGVFNNHSDKFHANYVHAGHSPMIEPKNILPVIDMLLHPDNAVNGQVITVDGGFCL